MFINWLFEQAVFVKLQIEGIANEEPSWKLIFNCIWVKLVFKWFIMNDEVWIELFSPISIILEIMSRITDSILEDFCSASTIYHGI